MSMHRRNTEVSLDVPRVVVSPGTEAANKARQLRRATTFKIQYLDPDAVNESFSNLLQLHLLTEQMATSVVQMIAVHIVNPTFALSKYLLAAMRERPTDEKDDAGNEKPVSPPRVMSSKVQRALQLRDDCDTEFQRFCETKARTGRTAAPSSNACGKPTRLEIDHRRPMDTAALDRLMRKISPAMNFSVTSHRDLIHILVNCAECATRVPFCTRCATKVSEFFEKNSAMELQTLYGRDLPSPDRKALEVFADAMAARVQRAMAE